MSTVTDHLTAEGVPFEILPHARAFTGLDEARALGIEADAVLKTVILDTRDDHVALVLPAGERLDLALVREAVGDSGASLANEIELSRDFGGFELGSLPPLPRLLGIEVYVDLEVKTHGSVVFAGGTQTESIRADAAALFANEPVRFAQLTEAWGGGRS
jgi:prolyl-tRNA editing enzyme YbaK/EbsC (Cys-tRNA(Pro) deacylase)